MLRYLAEETAGQCGPCVNGLASVAHGMSALAAGNAGRTVLQDLERWGGSISRRGACHHPDGAIRLLRSALTAFPERDRGSSERTVQCDQPRTAAARPRRSRARSRLALTVHLRLDPIACDGHGVCAELFVEGIQLDEWGYPIIDPGPIAPQQLDHARRAVFACPRWP